MYDVLDVSKNIGEWESIFVQWNCDSLATLSASVSAVISSWPGNGHQAENHVTVNDNELIIF